jgi:hypothetical protein
MLNDSKCHHACSSFALAWFAIAAAEKSIFDLANDVGSAESIGATDESVGNHAAGRRV